MSIMNSQYSNLLSTLYPVGLIYIGTQATCPLATLIQGSVWQIVGTNRALWCGNGSNANSTIDAGLPNHRHLVSLGTAQPHGVGWENGSWLMQVSGLGSAQYSSYASDDNSIYGRSTTVQPDAYIVNVWRRIS